MAAKTTATTAVFSLVNLLFAPVCLCLAARNRFLGLNLRIPEDVALLLNFCGRPVPAGLSSIADREKRGK
ncbi:unnamed protein product [Spirodela intermedia]|uniref:Secreted protein n=1 Tax=Spirodela intermedia TaxID=51605 RepID=A0ABN7EB71_SPIIN|nr:unnamed protein product [Spirodela intermedia]